MSNCSGKKYSIADGRAEAPAREAGTAKWKIPAEDMFPFAMGRKRVLLEAGSALENTESTGKVTEPTSLNPVEWSKQNHVSRPAASPRFWCLPLETDPGF